MVHVSRFWGARIPLLATTTAVLTSITAAITRMPAESAVDLGPSTSAVAQTFQQAIAIVKGMSLTNVVCAVAKGYRPAIVIATETSSTHAGCAAEAVFRMANAIAMGMCWMPVGHAADPEWMSTVTGCAMMWTDARIRRRTTTMPNSILPARIPANTSVAPTPLPTTTTRAPTSTMAVCI